MSGKAPLVGVALLVGWHTGTIIRTDLVADCRGFAVCSHEIPFICSLLTPFNKFLMISFGLFSKILLKDTTKYRLVHFSRYLYTFFNVRFLITGKNIPIRSFWTKRIPVWSKFLFFRAKIESFGFVISS